MSTVDIFNKMKETFPDQVELLEEQDWMARNWNE
jgi:hypothetical protein